MCIRDRYMGINKMKYLLFALFFLAIYAAEQENLTCWDSCSRKCKAQYGTLTDNCLKECNCTCNKECDDLCLKFNLGSLCRLKCGCFQTAGISVEKEEKKEEKKEGKKEQLLQNVNLANEASFGQMKWGTFLILFFVLATIVSGSHTAYKRYNIVKEYQKDHRVMNDGRATYQRLIQIHPQLTTCLLYTSPSPRDLSTSRMPSSA
eukprot:TRINITY_DN5894_c0_g1_i7.p1 TRINITY_DN5894_c0_g1~~TRINITY_DN5894_c0_g1_i7.p1  ORF type:complete len:205 (-),score=74.71 TRINITY_DN5894_c0_g1_i7:15-629(-)